MPCAVPELLPRRPRGFTGRRAELTALDLATAGRFGAIALVTGGAGVGKTALAAHWAHERRGDFPDGRLFADLCGYSDTPARHVTVVLREFLLALGVPVRRIPETEAGMGALYRSLTADRRMLVVLDNARDSEQVRPLLPGGDHSVTLVTSRDRLGGLVATDAARPVRLDELPAADCAALLAAILGADRVAAEPEAAARLAELCDCLPLALRVTAARLAAHPRWTLAALADELADEQRRLGLLRVEDTGVAAALRLTVQHLPEQARRMFRALGLHTGSELDRYSAAALAGCTPDQAAAALERLAAAHLVAESGPRGPGHPAGAYALHDLVRLYARALAAEADPDGLTRLLDHYLHTGLVATATAEPGSQPCFTPPPGARRPAAVREFEDRQAALAWYEAERATLRGAVAAAIDAGMHEPGLASRPAPVAAHPVAGPRRLGAAARTGPAIGGVGRTNWTRSPVPAPCSAGSCTRRAASTKPSPSWRRPPTSPAGPAPSPARPSRASTSRSSSPSTARPSAPANCSPTL